MFTAWAGVIILIISFVFMFFINKIDDEELPISKEQCYQILLLMAFAGLILYEIGCLQYKITNDYIDSNQNISIEVND